MEKLDFNKVVEMYMETSDKLEMVILKDGKNFSEHTDGKLFIHLPQAPDSTAQAQADKGGI